MTKDERRKFLRGVFNKHLRFKLHDFEWHRNHSIQELRTLKKAADLVDSVHARCEDSDDVYLTFKVDELRLAVNEIKDGFRSNLNLALKIGLLDAFDNHYPKLISTLSIEDFPEEEYEVLSAIGFRDPQTDIEEIVSLLTMHPQGTDTRPRHKSPVSERLNVADGVLKSAVKDFAPGSEVPKKSRHWFKGMGKIGHGVLLSIADIGLAVDMFDLPVSPETKTRGVLVSTTAGVGLILDGIDELRSE